MKLLPLGKKASQGHTMVDDDVYEWASKQNWRKHKRRNQPYHYVVSSKSKPWTVLSRVIMGVTDPKLRVDHKSRDIFDNRRENLRICDTRQNNTNQGPKKGRKYKGTKQTSGGRFAAGIGSHYKYYYIGSFDTEEEAALAYDKKASELFGEFASLNFPL